MKRILFLIPAFLLVGFVDAQSLDPNASYIRKNYEADYEATIKKHALNKWETDYEMVVYEINKQCDALVTLVDEFESDNTNIAYQAIQKWSIDGYKSKNIAEFKKLQVFGLKELMKMSCDWTMVQYEYDKQVKAKSAF